MRAQVSASSAAVVQVQDATVYTVRVQTARGRSAGMDDYEAAVQLCMIGKNRDALLHRIEQLELPEEGDDTMDDICEV